jgi:hypothetical protein
MATRRSRIWAVAVLAVALGAAAGAVAWRDPLLLPGTHTVSVYAIQDSISQQIDHEPGLLGRALGMCDADTYYVRDGDTKMCIVLSGPLGEVRASKSGGTVTVPAGDAASLRAMAAQDTGSPDPTTRLALRAGGRPIAIVAIADIVDGKAVSAPALD